MTSPVVQTGLDSLAAENFKRLAGCRVGVLAHSASVDKKLRHIVPLLSNAPKVELVRIFAPEHGLSGAVQDQVSIRRDGRWRDIPAIALYGDRFHTLWPEPESLADLDVLVADIQDVGSRYYTFFNTLAFCMEVAAQTDTRVMVLDRPNPIGGIDIEGPMLDPGMQSFVGYFSLPSRHGMTVGEMAAYVNREHGLGAELEVVAMEGWRRGMYYEDTGLHWVLPSPNMPTVDTAMVYPGGCLLEGTNLSEGRGTTRPFELFGAPYLDAEALCRRMEGENLPGVLFRPTAFVPTFHRYCEKHCRGLMIHVTDRRAFRPWLTYVLAIRHIAETHREFDWHRDSYEFVSDRLAIDLLLGSPGLRGAIERGEGAETFAAWDGEQLGRFDRKRREYMMYP